MTSFMERRPLELPSFWAPSAPLEADEDLLKHELVVQVLASLSSVGTAEPEPPARLPALPSIHTLKPPSPGPSQPSSPESVTFSSPQLLFHQHTVRSSERERTSRQTREQSLSADEERRAEEKRERRREKDRVRKRVQREKQRREKANQARLAQLNATSSNQQDARSSFILPPLHAAVALN